MLAGFSGARADAAGEAPRGRPRWRLMILGLCALALAVMAWLYGSDRSLYQHILTVWGIVPFRYPFVDWEYVPAGAACWRHGVDVYAADPCDVLGRVHDYSPLWLRAWFLPTGPFWRNVLGLGLGLSFFASAGLVIRPKSWREALVFAGALLSPMTVFLVERGNVDAIMFALLALSVVVSMRGGMGGLSYGLIMLAGLLKFYPLAAMGGALRERPRAFWTIAITSALILAVYYLGFRTELHEVSRNVPKGPYASDLFGASNLPAGLAVMIVTHRLSVDQLAPAAPRLLFAALGAALTAATFAGGYLVFRSRRLLAGYARMDELDRRLLAAGSALVAGCFFAGQSIGYRGVLLLFVIAGLVALRREVAAGAWRGLLTALIASTVLLMWDGVLRHALADGPWEHLRAIYWIVREGLWRVLIAFLIGAFALFASRSPVLTARPKLTTAPAA